MIDNRSGVQLVAAEGSAEELISIYSVEPSVVGWQVARWLFEHPEEDSHCRFMDSYNQLVRPHATKAQEVKGGLGTAGAWRSDWTEQKNKPDTATTAATGATMSVADAQRNWRNGYKRVLRMARRVGERQMPSELFKITDSI